MADDEGPSLGGRLGRYARVGASVGGLAARLAGERYLGWSLDRDEHAAELKRALGGLKGPLMKVAQMLSTIPDALPQEYARELAQLQANAPAMGWAFVRRRMAAELGPGLAGEVPALRAGGRGRRLARPGASRRAAGRPRSACKLQYPGHGLGGRGGPRQLKIVFAIGQRFDRAIRTDEIHAEIRTPPARGAGLRREARHMRALSPHAARRADVHVPEPVPELSTERLLTMTWLGRRAAAQLARSARQEERDALADNMFRAWYVPFYRYGVIHGDPHLGNYSVRPDGSVNLLDFGCIRVFPPRFVRGSIELYRALMTTTSTVPWRPTRPGASPASGAR